jgi:PAS domain S-box-containing protein
MIEATNAAAEHLFGRNRSDIVGRSNLILFKDPPAPEVSRAYLERLASHPELGGNSQDFLGLRDDGSEVETEVVTTPIRLGDGLHYLAVARDATARKRVERLKTEFVATVSHELRTPLTSIAGALGLLSGGAGGELDPKAHRLITIAHNNSERLVRLINDILDIEKIESGKIVFDVQPIPLTGLIEQVAQANEAFADQHDVGIEIETSQWDPRAIADRDRLIQVLTNLLSNAIKFSPAGGSVAVRVRPSGPSLRISVRDAGPGIPEEFRSRIFSKFAQADSTDTRQKGGTGLGLSIAKEIVDRMNGRIWFETGIGEGTTFHVELPALQAMPPGDDDVTALARTTATELPQVLHVDDDTDMLRLVASALEGRVEVHSTPSVVEAEAALRRYPFDAVILDIGMADGNGLDLVPVARTTSQDMRIVLFTAQDVGDLAATGVDFWLTKSKADLGVLTSTVLETLEPKDDE